MSSLPNIPNISQEALQESVREEYTNVAQDPNKGYHFHTGHRAIEIHGYDPELYANLPQNVVDTFAGTGNPFSAGAIHPGETVVDIGSGGGFDSLIAAQMVGDEGRVIGVDMTEAMLNKSRSAADAMNLSNVEFREGYAQSLPLEDEMADMVISNGVLNLTLNKEITLQEWNRVLKPGGRLQIGDIIISRPIPDSGLEDIFLWTS